MSGLAVPVIDRDADSLTIALALASAGFYVLPTRADGDAKHAGSVVGKGWPAKSSCDPETIVAWFAGTSHRVAVHCGRSGLIVVDVDHPEKLTDELRAAIAGHEPPFHSTRPDEPGRGHYVFAQPPGRSIGNGAGRTGKAWGQWRGTNGIILVGGEGREWLRTGEVPVLPESLARLLDDSGDTESAVSDAEVHEFVAAHNLALSPRSLDPIVAALTDAVENDESRHETAAAAACWAVREAIQGRFPARRALRRLEDEFVAAMAHDRRPGGKPERTLTRERAEAEFLSICAWAIGQEHHRAADLDADEPDPAAELQQRAHELAVADELNRRRVRGEAERRYALEGTTPPPAPASTLLTDLLAEEDDPDSWRVTDLWPRDGKIVLAAAQKSGKTTLVGNLVAALADCTPFLGPAIGQSGAGGFVVEPLGAGRTVVLLDFEMTRRKLRKWLRDHGIRKTDVVRVELLRGLTWDPRDPRTRKAWADHLRAVGCEVLVVDPLGPVMHALAIDENDNSAVGRLLNALDALVREAGIRELLVVHHTGHAGERSRGASVLRGWPDAEWRLLLADWPGRSTGREPPPDVVRFLAATGRDVALAERELAYDEETRHLSIGNGSRATHAVDQHVTRLAELVAEQPGITLRGIREALSDCANGRVPTVIRAAEGAGLLHVHNGPRRAQYHHPGVPAAVCDRCRADEGQG